MKIMKPIYIFDLDETTGAYYTYPGVNDIILLRDGFREILKLNEEKKLEMILATRGRKNYVEEIKRNLKERGINLKCEAYTKNDISIEGIKGYYKRYKKILHEAGVDFPVKNSIVIGDLLRIGPKENYSMEEYMETDFEEQEALLRTNYSLNDHPVPFEGESLIYAVLPRPMIYGDDCKDSLSLMFVLKYLEEMYKIGENNFDLGFKRANSNLVQKVISDKLSRRIFGYPHTQKYLIMKGAREDWKPLEKIM